MDPRILAALEANASAPMGSRTRMVNGRYVLNKGPTRGRGGFFSSLISEGGAAGGAALGASIGSIVPGVGTLIGAGLGGLIGGFGGRLAENKVRDDRFDASSFKQAAIEGGLAGALSAVAPAYKLAKGGLAARGAAKSLPAATQAFGGLSDDVAKVNPAEMYRLSQAGFIRPADVTYGLKSASSISGTGTSAVVGAVDDTAKVVPRVSRLTKLGTKVKSGGVGALDTKAGIGAFGDEAVRLQTAKDFKLPSGLKGLRKAETLVGNLENQIQPLLSGTRVSTQSVLNAIDDVGKSTLSPVAESPQLLTNIKNLVTRQSSGGYIGGDVLRSIRSQIGTVFKKNSTTPLAGLQRDVYHKLGETIGANSKQAKTLIEQQGRLFDVATGLSKRAEGVRIPFFGIGVKSPALGQVRDAGTDIASGALSGAGKVTNNAVIRQAVRQSPGNLVEALMSAKQPQQEQDYQAPTQDSYGEQPLGDTYGGLEGSSQYGALDEQQPQQSAYSLEQAIADLKANPNAKTQAQIMDYYNFVSKAEAAQAKATGAGGPNVTKVTAQQYSLAQRGQQALQQMANLLDRNPGVLNRTATPGRKLPIVGGFISNAAGTGDFDAIGYNIASSLLRIETGAQANESEIKNLQSQMIPRAGDSKETIARKLQQLNQAFSVITNAANNDYAETPQLDMSGYNLQGAY